MRNRTCGSAQTPVSSNSLAPSSSTSPAERGESASLPHDEPLIALFIGSSVGAGVAGPPPLLSALALALLSVLLPRRPTLLLLLFLLWVGLETYSSGSPSPRADARKRGLGTGTTQPTPLRIFDGRRRGRQREGEGAQRFKQGHEDAWVEVRGLATADPTGSSPNVTSPFLFPSNSQGSELRCSEHS